jgi:serine/threonine-protein kinase
MNETSSEVPEMFRPLLKFRPSNPPLAEGAWFGGIALQGMDGRHYLVAGKLLLLERGLYLPDVPAGRFLYQSGIVVAATTTLDEAQTHDVLQALARFEIPTPIQDIFGTDIYLPKGKDGGTTRWNTDTSEMSVGASFNYAYARKITYRNSHQELSGYVGADVFESADTAFRFMDVPMEGIQEFIKRLALRGNPNFQDHYGARDVFEVHAALPFSVDDFAYDHHVGGYRIKVSIGARLPREQFRFSITGPIPRKLSMDHKDWKVVEGDESTTLVLEYVIESDHKLEDINWRIALNQELIGKGRCGGRPPIDTLASTSRRIVTPLAPQRIKLPYGEWIYDPAKKLGKSGGFGEVFEGTDMLKRPLAIKRFKAGDEEVIQREIQVAREFINQKNPHVIPIFDAGRDANSERYFLVMARAQQNLQELIDIGGAVSEKEAIFILEHVVSGLEELGDSVHRDLKPANILLHEDAWKLADLSLARTAGADTSPNTVRGFWTCEYAAPEQWLGDRASKKTDIYALGCIIYALLNGRPPFGGSEEDLRQKHITGKPDSPLVGTRPMQILAQRCLEKNPEQRPSLDEVRQLLRIALEPGSHSDPIVAASASIAAEKSRRDAEKARQEQLRKSREQMAAEAMARLQEGMRNFFQDIIEKSIGMATRTPTGVALGSAHLALQELDFTIPPDAFSRSGWDVLTGASVNINWKANEFDIFLQHFSANLWFAKRPNDSTYRWWEIGYVADRGNEGLIHFGTGTPNWLDAIDRAMAGDESELRVAGTPVAADLEAEAAFLLRWRQRLADASQSLMVPYKPSW